jgi:hypothetical protein
MHVSAVLSCQERMQEQVSSEGKQQGRILAIARCWDHEKWFEKSFWRALSSTLHLVLSGKPILADTTVTLSCNTTRLAPKHFLFRCRKRLSTSPSMYCLCMLAILNTLPCVVLLANVDFELSCCSEKDFEKPVAQRLMHSIVLIMHMACCTTVPA